MREPPSHLAVAALAAVPSPAYLLGADGRLLSASRLGAQALGREADLLVGKRWEELGLEPPLVEALEAARGEALAQGVLQQRELPWPEGGRMRPHALHFSPLPEGALLVCARPLTEAEEVYARALALEKSARAEVEAADRRQAFLYQAMSTLFSHAPDPARMYALLAHLAVPDLADWCVVDALEPGGRALRAAVVHLDPADAPRAAGLPRRYGVVPDAPVGLQRVLATGEPELVPAVTESFLRAAASEPEHAALLGALGAGSYMCVPLRARGHILGAVLFATAGSGRRYGPEDLALAEDLCQRASLAIDNARLFGESRRATRAREELLAMVSHDLKSPLNSVVLAAQMLQRPSVDERTRRQAERIVGGAERMRRLIADLLDWGRIEAGRLPLQPALHPVGAMVTEALEAVRPQAEAAGLHTQASLPPPALEVHCDRSRLLQVLGNLLGNALKFTPHGGAVRCGAHEEKGEVLFWVEDNGPGISPEVLPHIFDRYWQAKDAVSRGTGLGLAIAKGIVEAHGGRIWAESTPGQGTRLSFTLPPSTPQG